MTVPLRRWERWGLAHCCLKIVSSGATRSKQALFPVPIRQRKLWTLSLRSAHPRIPFCPFLTVPVSTSSSLHSRIAQVNPVLFYSCPISVLLFWTLRASKAERCTMVLFTLIALARQADLNFQCALIKAKQHQFNLPVTSVTSHQSLSAMTALSSLLRSPNPNQSLKCRPSISVITRSKARLQKRVPKQHLGMALVAVLLPVLSLVS